MREERSIGLTLAGALLLATPAAAQKGADRRAFLDLYRELVETNTVVGVGSCTRAAQGVATRMRAAGFTDAELTPFAVPEHPEDGGLVAVLPGSDAALRPMLLLAHLDVVEARREDWKRDPFKLTQERGYFYGRGTVDDKAMAAIWADTLIRLKRQGTPPRRTIKLALTCGEETTYAFNGAEWLAKNRPALIAAEFALNEAGGGRVDRNGRAQSLSVQVGEKAAQNFTLTAIDAGGHSSVPTPDTAITALADALKAVQTYRFPIRFTATTREYLATTGRLVGGAQGDAIARLLADPANDDADAIVSRDRVLSATLRTTCVATLLSAGHAENALPQRATANVNCRIMPGETVAGTLATLRRLAGVKVAVTANQPVRPTAVPPQLDRRYLDPMREVAARHFPGVPLIPTMSTGATDAVFLAAAGIPVYGVPGILIDADANGIHGLDERIRVSALDAGRDYLFDLVRAYSF